VYRRQSTIAGRRPTFVNPHYIAVTSPRLSVCQSRAVTLETGIQMSNIDPSAFSSLLAAGGRRYYSARHLGRLRALLWITYRCSRKTCDV